VQELGYEVVVRKFRGIAAPKGLAPELIRQWEQAIQNVLKNPDYQASYLADNLRLNYINHAEYQSFIDEFANETRNYLRSVGLIE